MQEKQRRARAILVNLDFATRDCHDVSLHAIPPDAFIDAPILQPAFS
jgi:hypothetical protein